MAASFVKTGQVKAILHLVVKMNTYPRFHLSPDMGQNRHKTSTNAAAEHLVVS